MKYTGEEMKHNFRGCGEIRMDIFEKYALTWNCLPWEIEDYEVPFYLKLVVDDVFYRPYEGYYTSFHFEWRD